jgi:Tetratricopeptide repeat
VGERRYDEALALYHSALRQDAGNIGMRYDVGQLYERLRLYPDALLVY